MTRGGNTDKGSQSQGVHRDHHELERACASQRTQLKDPVVREEYSSTILNLLMFKENLNLHLHMRSSHFFKLVQKKKHTTVWDKPVCRPESTCGNWFKTLPYARHKIFIETWVHK